MAVQEVMALVRSAYSMCMAWHCLKGASSMAKHRKKRKEKFTLFSDHNGSLLRRQPGAWQNITKHVCQDLSSPVVQACCCWISTARSSALFRIAAVQVQGKVTAAYRKLASRVEALNLKALPTGSNRTSNVERVGWGQSCNTPVGVLGFVHHSVSTRALQSYFSLSGKVRTP